MVGLDLSQNAVDRANSTLSRRDTLSFVHGDAENLPFEEGEFDVVINVESSHSYPNLKRFIEKSGEKPSDKDLAWSAHKEIGEILFSKLKKFREAIDLYVEDCLLAGDPVPEEDSLEYVELQTGTR